MPNKMLKVTKIYSKENTIEGYVASDVYQIGNERLSLAEKNFLYTTCDGDIFSNDMSELPFPRSVVLTQLSTGEISEGEFNKIRKRKGGMIASYNTGKTAAFRKFMHYVLLHSKELADEDAIKTSAKLMSTGDF